MLHTITATVCLHPIRSSAELPHTVDGINFEVPYCGSCARSFQIAEEHDVAERQHRLLEAVQDPDCDRSKLRAARIRYNKAHLVYLEDLEQRAERYRQEHRISPHCGAVEGLTASSSISRLSTTSRSNKKVRLDAMNDHRPEAEYRDQQQFDRTAPLYKPGRHADESGNGFINTSDPYESDLSDEETETDIEGEENHEHAVHMKHNDDAAEGMSREELVERRNVIQERLNHLLKERSSRSSGSSPSS